MKKFNVLLDESKVQQLREASRKRAYVLQQDVTWVDLLREAADMYLTLAAEGISETTGATTTIQKGTR